MSRYSVDTALKYTNQKSQETLQKKNGSSQDRGDTKTANDTTRKVLF